MHFLEAYWDVLLKYLIAIWEWILETDVLKLNICISAFVPVAYQIELYLDILGLFPLSCIIALYVENIMSILVPNNSDFISFPWTMLHYFLYGMVWVNVER